MQQTYADALTSAQGKGVRIDSPKTYLSHVARNIALNKKKRQQIVYFENVGIGDDTIGNKWHAYYPGDFPQVCLEPILNCTYTVPHSLCA